MQNVTIYLTVLSYQDDLSFEQLESIQFLGFEALFATSIRFFRMYHDSIVLLNMQELKMDKYKNTRAYKIDKQVPGCLGRMVNLFDVSAGVSANKLLTDKTHLEGDNLLLSHSKF